jgi:hypothetical protein
LFIIAYLVHPLVPPGALACAGDTVGVARVVVRDQLGMPIHNAVVQPYAVRATGDGVSHFLWPEEEFGAPAATTTDEEGRATISYPLRIPGVGPVREIWSKVNADGYVGIDLHGSLTGEELVAALQKGDRARISAVDLAGVPVTDFGIAFPRVSWRPTVWRLDDQGYRGSGSLQPGNWQIMAVQPRGSEPAWFSDLITVRVREKQAFRLSGLKLSPGAVLKGKLGDNVPRPVVDGYVIAAVAPKPAESTYSDVNPSLVWHDKAPIADDGTFEFPSIPRSGVVQLIALCDGFISASIPMVQRNELQAPIEGQYFTVDGPLIEPTVQMMPTGTLEVRCVNRDGEPLAGIEVYSWPNQRGLLSGSTYLGSVYPSLLEIQAQLQNRIESVSPQEYLQEHRFRAVTDNTGTAVLRNLPIGRNEYVEVKSSEYRLPRISGSRWAPFKLPDTEPKQLVLTLEKIP